MSRDSRASAALVFPRELGRGALGAAPVVLVEQGLPHADAGGRELDDPIVDVLRNFKIGGIRARVRKVAKVPPLS